MRIQTLLGATIVLAAAAPALAQTPSTPPPVSMPRYEPPSFGPAPWWMELPVLPSMGHVEMEVRANRAHFGATFQAVAKNAPEATKLAAEKVRALAQVLAGYGPEKVRVEVSFSQRPIFEQYRDKDGNLISNQRADKIDSYEANATIHLEVRDVALLERVYNAVVAARPNSTQTISFELVASNETNTELYGKAVADARRRAQLAVAAVGAQLGPVKLIDPSGRACETDILLQGADRDTFLPPPVQVAEVADSPSPAPPPVLQMREAQPSAAPGPSAQDLQLPVQPPMQKLNASACVIYSLKG